MEHGHKCQTAGNKRKPVSCKIIQINAVFRRQNNEKSECLPND